MGFRIGRGGGTGRHAVLRGPWAIACVGSNPTLGTNRPVWIAGRRSQVVKAEVCKTSIGGSNPPVASKMKMIKPSKDGLANGQPVLAFHGPGTIRGACTTHAGLTRWRAHQTGMADYPLRWAAKKSSVRFHAISLASFWKRSGLVKFMKRWSAPG